MTAGAPLTSRLHCREALFGSALTFKVNYLLAALQKLRASAQTLTDLRPTCSDAAITPTTPAAEADTAASAEPTAVADADSETCGTPTAAGAAGTPI